MSRIALAIMSLRPGVEWTMNGEDIENIIWHTEGAKPLTSEEVDAEIKRLEKENADARAAAIAHAKSLGFTDDMIAVMYPGLAEQEV